MTFSKRTMATDTKKAVSTIDKLASELFVLMGVKAKPQVSFDEVNGAIVVNIESEDETGLLIGNRGETLSAIQYVLGLAYAKQTDEWQRIIVNVADWRERQESRLVELATQTANRAVESGQPQNLYNLNPNERRIIHMTLAESQEVETVSEGEGKDRYLVVRPK